MTTMIRASGLVKHYGEVKALDGLDLDVEQGTVLAVLGPNGAGKTTAVRLLTTLLSPDAGTATINGFDVVTEADEVRGVIGLSGQFAAVDEYLTGFENLRMVGRLYGMSRADASDRARELLARFSLTDAADRPSKTYSGGMRRRLDLAGAIVASPAVIVLDEPTTGLDPRSRRQMWDVIAELVEDGSTVLLTTQYLEEADRLADDIIVIDHGRQIARGTADELKSAVGGDRIEIIVADSADAQAASIMVQQVAKGEVHVDERHISAAVSGRGSADLLTVLASIEEASINVLDVGLRRPTLDDVFLTLTGRVTEGEPS